jgi:hypothetical protein
MEEINVYLILVRILERKRLLRRPRCKGEDYIRLNLREIGWKGVDWIHLAQNGDQ